MKKTAAKKAMPGKKAEMKIEKAENRLAKSMPAGKRREFASVQKREAKLEKREK